MGFSKPVVCEIAYKTYAINEFGMATCYALLGKKSGLLIDTGCGMYPMKEVADRIFGKLPYQVVLTHSHGDHVGSMDLWDQVYLHRADWEALDLSYLEQNKAMLQRYPLMLKEYGVFDVYDISPEQAHYPETLPELLPVEDGQVFDLGGRKVTVVHMPGHTPGEIALVDPSSRILFSGDACNQHLGIFATTIREALEGMEKLATYRDQFDRNFNGHIGYGSDNVNESLPESVLDDCLYIMRGLLDGSVQPEKDPAAKGRGVDPCFVSYGNVRIGFDGTKIR